MHGLRALDDALMWGLGLDLRSAGSRGVVPVIRPRRGGASRARAVQWFCRRLAAAHRETWMHSVRVARCVKHIMVALGANGDDVRRAVQSALLHDIGKLLLRDVDIDKAGPFDATEYELVQAHPTLGATLLAPVEVLAPLIPAVLHHHERWDGSGYPYGLAADAIPSLARVVAVADSYDAMTSDRPYRAALAHNVTVDELLLQSGRQFATEIVDAFVSGRRTVRHA